MLLNIVLLIIILLLTLALLRKNKKDYTQEKKEISILMKTKETLNNCVYEIGRKEEALRARIEEESKRYEQLKEIVFNYKKEQDEKISEIDAEAQKEIENINWKIRSRRDEYASLIAPMELLEKEKLEKLFYCIYLTEEEKSDIMYLLTEVAPKVNHKDIVSKLVWQEYIKTPLDTTLRRVGVTDGPGIYKITNIDNGKCYVGKAVNVRKRIQDHFKSVVGIQNVSDQFIHQEIKKLGLDKWSIEQVCECLKDELSEKEKFYISFFKATEHGYNLKAGG